MTHPLKNTDADLDALDWGFSLTEPVEGMEPAEIRRALFWHWRKDPKRFWRNQDIPTIARLAAALPKMMAQVPKEFRKTVTGGKIPYVNPTCPECNGTGSLGCIPHPAYEEGTPFELHLSCPCARYHPYPWRIERKEIV